MTFRRARTQEQIFERKKEIIAACRQLYIAGCYDSITMEKISNITSISRASLYNYFATKEEIVLELLQECYINVGNLLKTEFDNHKSMNKKEFCDVIAKILSEQELFLSIKSIHLLALENNCSQEKVDKIKINRMPFFKTLHSGVKKFFPNITQTQENEFVILMTALINGLYPITHLTDKQREALKKVTPNYMPPKFYDIFKKGLYALMHDF